MIRQVLRGHLRPGDIVPTAVDGTTTIRVRAVDLLGPEPPGRPTPRVAATCGSLRPSDDNQ